MSKYRNFLIILFTVFIFLGCENLPFLGTKAKKQAKAKPPADSSVVAVIGDFYITSPDLDKEIDNYNALVIANGLEKNKIDTKDKKIAYLRNELVRKYILYQEALDRGLEKKEEVAKALERTKVNLLVSELLREEIEKIDVSNADIEDFYNQNKDLLKEPEQRKVLEIVTNTEDEAKQAYIELLKPGGDFAALAKQYSKAQSAANGGDLGFVSLELDPKKRIRFDKFYEIAFSPSLEAGSISSIFKGPEGYYIIKVESMKKSEPKSLSELRENIKSWLLFEKQQKAIANLANKLQGETKVEIYEEKIQ